MSKLVLVWSWLLPGLICLDPVGAIAYYSAGAEKEPPLHESPRATRRTSVPDARTSAAILPLAGL